MRCNLYLQRWENYKKQAWTIKMRIQTHPSAKRSKSVCIIVTRRELGQSPKGGHSALLKCRSALQKCQMMHLDTERSSVFGCVLDSLFSVFLSSPCTQMCFHPQSMISISFLDNSSFFKNNYLVDKYPKINLDKVQIIQNFIIIQHPFYKYACNPILNTNYQSITKLFN